MASLKTYRYTVNVITDTGIHQALVTADEATIDKTGRLLLKRRNVTVAGFDAPGRIWWTRGEEVTA